MEGSQHLRSLARGLTVLRTLEEGVGLSLHDISRRTQLAKPTLLRILRTLEREAYVRRGLTDQLYYANLRTPVPAVEAQGSVLAEVAGPVMDRLCAEVLWPSDLAVYHNGSMRVQETSRRRSPFMMNRAVTRFRIHVLQSGMGRAYLANCDEAEQAAILAELAGSDDPLNHLARDRRKVEGILAEVRAKGYAARETGYFVTQPLEARVRAIAVPIMAAEAALGSINLAWISQVASVEEFARSHLARLHRAAHEIGTAFEARTRPPAN